MTDWAKKGNLRILSNVFITSSGHDTVKRVLRGQIFDGSDRLVSELRRPPSSRTYLQENAEGRSTARRLPAAIYGHHFHTHYGHFLLETYTGLAALQTVIRENPTVPILLHVFNFHRNAKQYEYYKDISARALGISAERLILIEEPLVVDILLCQPIRFLMPQELLPRKNMPEAFASMRLRLRRSYGLEPKAKREKIIYLSRRSVTHKGAGRRVGAVIEREEELEKKLKEFGVQIIFPERHSFPEQLKIYGEAKAIIAFQGSGLHNIILTESGTHMILIPVEDTRRRNFFKPAASNDCTYAHVNVTECVETIEVEGRVQVAVKAAAAAASIKKLLIDKGLL